MNLVKKPIVVLLLLFWTSAIQAQNWMMAQEYLISALDSMIHLYWPNTGMLAGYYIASIDFDEKSSEYSINFTDTIICSKLDTPLKPGEKPDIIVNEGQLMLGLIGGVSIIEYNDGDIEHFELPDLSKGVYIYNETGKEISVYLSGDDKNFESYNISSNQFYLYPCLISEYAYIKIISIKSGKETVEVFYKLERAKGYKVKFDNAKAGFEVYLDERMDMEDFRN